VAAQDGVGKRVKCPPGHPIAATIEEQAGAPQHLTCCLAGEGEQENLGGIDAGFDEARNSEDQRASLAGAGAGHDKQWAAERNDGLVLRAIEF